MSSKRQLSPVRLVAYLAGAVIVISLFAPSALGVLGPIGVFVMLVAIYVLMFKRPRGRPSKDTAKRLSGYAVRDSYKRLPESALLALAVWSMAASLSASIGAVDAAVLAVIAGSIWAITTRTTPARARDIAAGVVGAVGLFFSVSTLLRGDECGRAISESAVRLAIVLVIASLGVAVTVRLWKFATLRQARISAFFLAALGLLELIEFAVAPVGQDIATDLSGRLPLVLLIAGVLLAAALCAINPPAAEAMLGTGVAVGATYLLFVQLQQADISLGPGCTDVLPQLVMVTVFTLVVVVAGSDGD